MHHLTGVSRHTDNLHMYSQFVNHTLLIFAFATMRIYCCMHQLFTHLLLPCAPETLIHRLHHSCRRPHHSELQLIKNRVISMFPFYVECPPAQLLLHLSNSIDVANSSVQFISGTELLVASLEENKIPDLQWLKESEEAATFSSHGKASSFWSTSSGSPPTRIK